MNYSDKIKTDSKVLITDIYEFFEDPMLRKTCANIAIVAINFTIDKLKERDEDTAELEEQKLFITETYLL